MRTRSFFFWVALAAFLGACSNNPSPKIVPEREVELGYGFRRATLAEPSSASFEDIGHFEYLYHDDQRLCQLGACSVSPTGRYAIYQDRPSGDLFLFRRADRNTARLTSSFVGLVESFVWHEEAGTVEVHFGTGHEVKTFPLQ
jgi:hypothetical protein